MKSKQISFSGALLATVFLAGASHAAVLAYDEFNTDAAADPLNGIYQTGVPFGNPVNTNVVGGTIVGFDGTAWTTNSSFIEPYAQVMRLVKRTYSGTYAGREISPLVSGRSQAYAKATMRILSGTGGSDVPGKCWAYAGFSATYSLGSAGGAAVGFYWDGAEWDLALRYNQNGSVGVATIMNGAAYDTTYEIYWSMDETLDTIKVWVDTNDPSATPTLAVDDWTGTVKDITHLSAGHSETGDSDVYVYDLALADKAEEIGMLPAPSAPGLLVRDDFNTSSSAYTGFTNGIYQTGTDIADAGGNATCVGGTIVGFDASNGWGGPGSTAFFDAYANLLRLYHRTYSATYLGRAITTDLTGKTVAYARTSLNMRAGTGPATPPGYAYVGFASNDSLGSAGGATVGYEWDNDNAQWNLVLRYKDAVGPKTVNIMTNSAYLATYNIFWAMDADADTIKVWVNENDSTATPDLTVTDWVGTIEEITHFSAGFADTGASDIWVYDIMLGETPESIGMGVPPTQVDAEIVSIEPVSGNVVKLVVRTDYPEFCYPKSKTALPLGTWDPVAHSTNGVDGFVTNNLTYSAAEGSDFVIYIQADPDERFIKIGAQ